MDIELSGRQASLDALQLVLQGEQQRYIAEGASLLSLVPETLQPIDESFDWRTFLREHVFEYVDEVDADID